ncbi:MAG: Ig-like domain-containing protein [Gemmatimonadaceae bacterium]|nr:Ig-like domain-containing protein [Gemmatimonadaceae bacterium]
MILSTRHFLRLFRTTVAVGILSACVGEASVTQPCRISSVLVAVPIASLTVGQTTQAVANYSVQNCTPLPTVTWATNNDAVATVSATGLVTGVSVGGPVTIRATVGGQIGSAVVSIR